MSAGTYVFNAAQTGGTRFLDENGDTVAWLRADVFPPIGTDVSLPDGSGARVKALLLDMSNDSDIAQVLVTVGRE